MVEPSFLALTRTPSITGSWADDTLPLNAAVVCACVDASPPPKLAVRLRLASSQNCLQCMFTSRNRFWHSMAYPVAHDNGPKMQIAGANPGHRSLATFAERQSSGSTF